MIRVYGDTEDYETQWYVLYRTLRQYSCIFMSRALSESLPAPARLNPCGWRLHQSQPDRVLALVGAPGRRTGGEQTREKELRERELHCLTPQWWLNR